MPSTAPPYALDTFGFRFHALATYAGRAPLGGDREMALAALVAARLAQAMIPPISLDPLLAGGRADRAKLWLSSLTMPQPARMALLRCFDTTKSGGTALADAVAEVARTITGHIDAPAQQELASLVADLRLYYDHTP